MNAKVLAWHSEVHLRALECAQLINVLILVVSLFHGSSPHHSPHYHGEVPKVSCGRREASGVAMQEGTRLRTCTSCVHENALGATLVDNFV